jgi:heme exporter protein D
MDTFHAFLAMGGYADFVWPAYGLAFAALIGALAISWRGLKARERLFEELKRDRAAS